MTPAPQPDFPSIHGASTTGGRVPLHLRIGDAERQDVCSVLGEHYAAGRLDISEFSERQQLALAATTAGQLEMLLADLPRPRPSTPTMALWNAQGSAGATVVPPRQVTWVGVLQVLIATGAVGLVLLTLMILGQFRADIAMAMFSAMVVLASGWAALWGVTRRHT